MPSRFPVGVLFAHELRRFIGGQPKLILDVGANVGQSALAFARTWPDAQAHSFEPVRATFEQLVGRCAGYPQVQCHHCALGEALER